MTTQTPLVDGFPAHCSGSGRPAPSPAHTLAICPVCCHTKRVSGGRFVAHLPVARPLPAGGSRRPQRP